MKASLYWRILMFLSLSLLSSSLLLCAETKVSVVVVDDDGRPVPFATVDFGWTKVRSRGNGWGSGRGEGVRVETNIEGLASVGVSSPPSIGVDCKGFYRFVIRSDDRKVVECMSGGGPVEVSLTRIKSPASMYVRQFSKKTPIVNSPFDIDLVIGDYLPPHGIGQIGDVTFLIAQTTISERHFDRIVKMIFFNDGGIIPFSMNSFGVGSQLRSPAEAPEIGYRNIFSWEEFLHASPEDIKKLKVNNEYLPGSRDPRFLTRKSFGSDSDGYLIKLNRTDNKIPVIYGKIYGRLQVTPVSMNFRYYLNPHGTRSLEWDMKNNLAGNVSVPIEP